MSTIKLSKAFANTVDFHVFASKSHGIEAISIWPTEDNDLCVRIVRKPNYFDYTVTVNNPYLDSFRTPETIKRDYYNFVTYLAMSTNPTYVEILANLFTNQAYIISEECVFPTDRVFTKWFDDIFVDYENILSYKGG